MRNPHSLFTGWLLSLWLTGLAAPVHGGSASLLLDIWSGELSGEEISVQARPLSLGSVALVSISEPSSGDELWVTDGTAAGTRLLADRCPGSCSSSFTSLGVIGQVGIFGTGLDGNPRLWRSDGTRLGTYPLAPEAGGTPVTCGSERTTASTGSALFLSARTEGSCSLWRTDGTTAGTVKLLDTTPSNLTAAGSLVFFTTESSQALWRSDGTPEGTVRLRILQSGLQAPLVAVGSRLLFIAPEDAPEGGLELWTSDGTVEGTKPLTRFGPADPFIFRSDSFDREIVFQEAGDLACFLANDGVSGRELWCSDGTAAGTRPATAMVLASPFVGLDTWRVERIGRRLLFRANDGLSGNRWWTSDGRPESTAPLEGCPGGCPVHDLTSEPVRVGGQVFFTALGEGPFDPDDPPTTDLWVTDGTGAGTRRMVDFCNECRVDQMRPLLGKLFFSAGNFPFNFDLWASDGTPEGTRRLIPVDGFANEVLPFPPVALGGRALLVQEKDFFRGPQLWVSDGTPAGTEELSFLAGKGATSEPRELVPTSDGVRLIAFDGEASRLWESHGTAATTVPVTPVEAGMFPEHLTPFGNLTLIRERFSDTLWRTDGTEAGTFQLTPEEFNQVGEPVVVGRRALFLARDPDGSSLWATDGTAAGTQEIAEVPEGGRLIPAGTAALIQVSFDRLWWTDGTPEGTREVRLRDEFNGFEDGNAVQLGAVIFFHARSRTSGSELWRTDGTIAGTYPLAEWKIRVPGDLAVHRGSLYFVASTEFPYRLGLWRSDGTNAGTVLLRTFRDFQGFSGESFWLYAPLGDLLAFVVRGADGGFELWRTDGTPEGTVLVRDLLFVEGSLGLSFLAALNGRLYFSAASLENGVELWESDGTPAGTRLIQDIAPGPLSSDPENLLAAGGRLYFTADDGIHGREPWVFNPGGAACVPSGTVLCLDGGRFKVEVEWRSGDDHGSGRAVALTPDTGTFWFFNPSNVEVVLKVLDGRGVNGHHWVFYGALSNVEYIVTVTDTETGAARRYFNPPGRLGSVGDTQAFGPQGASAPGTVTIGPAPVIGEAIAVTRTTAATGSCAPSSTRLCLNNGRFAVEARWKDFNGNTGAGQAVSLAGGDTGYFWFFNASNVEVVLKVLDGRPLNDKFWVFYGALSNVEYTLTVTDTETGMVKTYTNPSGRLASVADTGAF